MSQIDKTDRWQPVQMGTDEPARPIPIPGSAAESRQDALVEKQLQHTPDGAPAAPHERHISLRVGIMLGLGGMVIAVLLLLYTGGWMAAATGAVFLMMYYLVAWAVVWAPGVIRAKEEEEAEEVVEIKRQHSSEPAAPPPF